MKWRLKIVPIAFTTDFEAQGTFGFESISAGAHMFCRVCTFNESVDDAYTAATDFLTTPSWTKRRGKRPRVHCPWAERTADEVQRQMEELADLDETAAKKFSTDTGIFSSTAPLLPEVVPGFNIVTMRPQDIMHLEGCGILLPSRGLVYRAPPDEGAQGDARRQVRAQVHRRATQRVASEVCAHSHPVSWGFIRL